MPDQPTAADALESVELLRSKLMSLGNGMGTVVLAHLRAIEVVLQMPQREPRAWPRVVHAIGAGGWPDVVETTAPGRPTDRWTLVTEDGLYTGPRGGRYTLIELRTIGDVTEVLDA